MEGETLLNVRDLYVYYDSLLAIDGVSLEVGESEIISVIGGNGVGKTTLLKAIMGVISPKRGKIIFEPEGEIQGLPSHKIAESGISCIPEGRQILTSLTVRQNLLMGAYILKDKQRIKVGLEEMFVRFPILKERENQMALTLSGGEQQMLAIARCLMSYPTLILMDEPSLGLAPLIIKELFDLIKEFKKERRTIVLVEQNASQALQVCDRAYVMQGGRFVLSGRPNELVQNKLVKETYLGG
jgi:branched-chain amino acid transport system ATP-binding protein